MKDGETEKDREKRLAHNLYMKFYRSLRSNLTACS